MGICPHFNLWRYLFAVTLLKKREKKRELSMPMGCTGISLRNNQVNEYPPMHLSTSNKEWHLHWFYVKDDVAAPLPAFSGRIIEEVLESWKWGVPDKDKKKIKDHLAALQILKERGMKGSGIISAYHMRRVALLMARALPLHHMVPGASLKGTVLVIETLPPPKWRSASRRRWSP